MRLVRLRALADNWIHLAVADGRAWVVDPGDDAPVMAALAAAGARLEAILLTHRHADHTGGVAPLRRATGCRVFGPAECAASGLDRIVGEGDVIDLPGGQVRVLSVPGHTAGHVAYLAPGAVWTGDTLFVGGCGRALECGAEVLWRSLLRLANLPPDTRVCDGHDYLEDNLEFALSLLPGDPAISGRLAALRAAGGTAPGPPGAAARATTYFRRAGAPAVAAAVGLVGAPAAAVFAELRRRKDAW
jgi:hydroxyacylglutathione hydrolase